MPPDTRPLGDVPRTDDFWLGVAAGIGLKP